MKSTTTLLACGALLSASLLSAQSTVKVANVATRGLAGTGDDTMIAGVVVEGPSTDYVQVLFRGIGPTLADYDVANVLSDPALTVFTGTTELAANDNWSEGGQSYAIRATGFAPAYENESAVIANLVPGLYSAHLHGEAVAANGLVEAYFLEEKSIPANLVASGGFSTLLAAVTATGLDAVLSGPGPFTLFAPTDEAFAKLPEGTVESLLGDLPTLTNILLYHVVSGTEVPASAVADGPLMMANGLPASLSVENGAMIDNANIIEVDWMGTNGTIHVIDTVILPGDAPEGQTIVENLVAQGDFTTLVAAVQAAGLVDTLNSAGPFTLFAPTDAAFAKLPAGTVENLLLDENIPTLRDILLYHVIQGAKVESSAVTAGEVTMANGDMATLSTEGGVMIENATVTGVDWQSSNGVIHFIDTVILPPM